MVRRGVQRVLTTSGDGAIAKMPETVEVRYLSPKQLLTLDVPFLLQKIFNEFGDDTIVSFEPMNEEERAQSVGSYKGVSVVKNCMWIVEKKEPRRRRSDLEEYVVKYGRK